MAQQDALTDEERKAGARAIERMEKVARKWPRTRLVMFVSLIIHGIGGFVLFIFGAMALERAKGFLKVQANHEETFERHVNREISDVWDMLIFMQSALAAYLPIFVGMVWMGMAVAMGVLLYHRWNYGNEMALQAKLMKRQMDSYTAKDEEKIILDPRQPNAETSHQVN